MAKMAAEYQRFCRITSRIKDDHISQSRSKINTVFDSEIKLQKEKIIAVYVPDIFAAELFRSYKDKPLRTKCYFPAESMEAPELVWNQGSGEKFHLGTK